MKEKKEIEVYEKFVILSASRINYNGSKKRVSDSNLTLFFMLRQDSLNLLFV